MDITISKLKPFFFAILLGPVPSFAEPLWTWSGDLRIRGQLENQDAADARKSLRLRGRAGVHIAIEENLSAEFRLASMPTSRSTNQVLGDEKEAGFSRRYFGLDLAFAEYRPFANTRLQLGRLPQWQQRPGGSQVLLDEDIAMEGYALKMQVPLSEEWRIDMSAGSSLVRENYDSLVYSEDQTDNVLHAVDLTLVRKSEFTQIRLGAGFLNFTGLQNQRFADLVAGGAPLGNSEDALGSGRVKNNFKPMRFFADAQFALGGLDWNPFVEQVTNFETVDANRAWWLGVGVKSGAWAGQLAYAELQSDVVPAVFTFSDFAGGQTDSRGFVAHLQYAIAKNASLKWTQFANRQRFSTENLQYNRSHLDLAVSF